jgi:hypothetical protein
MSSTRLGDGRLQVTLTAGAAASGNRLISITFGPDPRIPVPNAVMEFPGVPGQVAPGSTYVIPGSPVTYSFHVRRAAGGAPATLPMTVTDACGTWQTLVGGGTIPF